MRCHSSKYLLIAILTFIVGVGITQVWRSLERARTCFLPAPSSFQPSEQPVRNKTTVLNKHSLEPDFCEEIKENPKFPHAPVCQYLTVSGGVLNRRVCNPPASLELIASPALNGKEIVVVHVTVDEDGFVTHTEAVTKTRFPKKIEKIAKGLRVRPTILSEKYFKTTGVLVFHLDKNSSDR